jgi:hypothetical protein
MRRLLAGVALCVSAVRVDAQAVSDSAAITGVVTKLFDAMRARDTTTMRALFAPNASMQSLRDIAVTFDKIDGWIAGVARAPQGVMLDERLGPQQVRIDGNLATVWVDYWFYVGPRFSHCGVDAFQLARINGAWKIFSVVDTRRTTGCAPAPV